MTGIRAGPVAVPPVPRRCHTLEPGSSSLSHLSHLSCPETGELASEDVKVRAEPPKVTIGPGTLDCLPDGLGWVMAAAAIPPWPLRLGLPCGGTRACSRP